MKTIHLVPVFVLMFVCGLLSGVLFLNVLAADQSVMPIAYVDL